jgi:hypothetical protein
VAVITNIFIDQGASYSNILTVASSTGAINLTTYTIKSQLRKSYGSSTYYDFTATIYDAVTGKVRLQLSSEQSSAIPAGKYLYDVELTNTTNGLKVRLVEGVVIVNPEITKT